LGSVQSDRELGHRVHPIGEATHLGGAARVPVVAVIVAIKAGNAATRADVRTQTRRPPRQGDHFPCKEPDRPMAAPKGSESRAPSTFSLQNGHFLGTTMGAMMAIPDLFFRTDARQGASNRAAGEGDGRAARARRLRGAVRVRPPFRRFDWAWQNMV
jgi:hypothetical protein